jgi:hypothetical protein
MSVVYSKKLSQIIEKKLQAKLLPQVKKTVMWHYVALGSASSFAHNQGEVIDLLKVVAKKHGLPCDFTIAVAEKSTRRCWVFVFDLPELEAIELVKKKAVRGKVPRKVRVRMVADRLENAEHMIESRKDMEFSRALLTKEGFKKAVRAHKRSAGYAYGDEIPWFLLAIHDMMIRDDMDDSIFDDAWDLIKVRKVMVA